MDLWNTIFLYNPVVVRFHVNFPGCNTSYPSAPRLEDARWAAGRPRRGTRRGTAGPRRSDPGRPRSAGGPGTPRRGVAQVMPVVLGVSTKLLLKKGEDEGMKKTPSVSGMGFAQWTRQQESSCANVSKSPVNNEPQNLSMSGDVLVRPPSPASRAA